MAILKNFDMEALRKERAKLAASGGVNLVESLRQISPDIEKLKVGETAEIPIPAGMSIRKHVMSITAKLNNLTPKGGEWEGRQFKVASNDANTYVQRGEDLPKGKAVVRARGNGRKPGTPNKPKGDNSAPKADDKAPDTKGKVKEHS